MLLKKIAKELNFELLSQRIKFLYLINFKQIFYISVTTKEKLVDTDRSVKRHNIRKPTCRFLSVHNSLMTIMNLCVKQRTNVKYSLIQTYTRKILFCKLFISVH